MSRLFSTDSVWNRPDVGSQPLGDEHLAQELAQEATSEIKQGIGPWIETSDDSTPIYSVGPDQRCVTVHLDVTETYGHHTPPCVRSGSAAGGCPSRRWVRCPSDAHPAVHELDVGILASAPRR